MGKTCCFTGYRPQKLTYLLDPESIGYLRLWDTLAQLVSDAILEGYDHFISGFAQGVDLMAAAIINDFKVRGFNITLEAALPAMDQTRYWSDETKKTYYSLLDAADYRHCVDTSMTRYSPLKRNAYMVDRSDLVIAVFSGRPGGTAHTVKLAQKKKRTLWIIDPCYFEVTKENDRLL